MAQYPNEKHPQSSWMSPPPAQAYASRDSAPGEHASSSYSQAPQGYYPPPEGPPPPDYGYAQAHPQEVPKAQETWLGPPAPSASPYSTPAPAPAGYPAAPAPAGTSATPAPSSEQGGGIMMSLGAFFGNKGPPPMWSRQPPPPGALPYTAFPPMCLISHSKELTKGFPELPPPCAMNPHPFATHDVMEEDWKRFLADIKQGASLTAAQRIRSNVIPMVTGMNFITGFFATNLIEKRQKFKNRQAAGDVVDHWNHYFFGPRRMEVVLCQASERLSGRLGAAPVADPYQTRMAHGLRQRSEDSSSDSSDDERYGHGHEYGYEYEGRGFGRGRGRGRRERRAERRADRRERRAERRDRKARGEYKEPYQLFITVV